MSACPCCSGKEFSECCEPILLGKSVPPTAAALMRARYTAYTRSDLDYLYQSSGPTVRGEFDRESMRKWAESAEWHGFEILRTEDGGEADQRGVVEFVARYTINQRRCNHREIAEFYRLDGAWTFHDGQIVVPSPVRRETPRIGRNDLCPCDSGRKYKKCCGGESAAVSPPSTSAAEVRL